MKKMNVLSLFDGMSCGQIALERVGVEVDKYYASEIDKYAIKVTMSNYPNTIQLGSVIDLDEEYLKTLDIDVLIGGSPCQGFSMAGKRKGSATKDGVEVTNLDQYLKLKEDGFEFDGQSYLFWEYVRVWKIVKPKYFLLENVKVSKKWLPMFNEAMGVEPIMINSSLVSAQNRARYYWTNIKQNDEMEDKKIQVTDILDETFDYNPTIEIDGLTTIDKTIKPSVAKNIVEQNDEIKNSEKSFFTMKCSSGFQDNKIGLTKVPCLRAGNNSTYIKDGSTYRRLTATEWERLQTVPVGYTGYVSNTQRQRMLGNGWTVDVVAHIFNSLKDIK